MDEVYSVQKEGGREGERRGEKERKKKKGRKRRGTRSGFHTVSLRFVDPVCRTHQIS